MEQSGEGARRAWGSVRHSDGRKVISEPWNEEEDKKLGRLVERIGKKDWCMIASVMEGRTARQCRERYCNHVDDAINRGELLPPRACQYAARSCGYILCCTPCVVVP